MYLCVASVFGYDDGDEWWRWRKWSFNSNILMMEPVVALHVIELTCRKDANLSHKKNFKLEIIFVQ